MSMFGHCELRLPFSLQTRLSAQWRLRGRPGSHRSRPWACCRRSSSVRAWLRRSPVRSAVHLADPRPGAWRRRAVLHGPLGMGVPLVAGRRVRRCAATASRRLDGRGEKFFGLLLLAMAVWILSPVLPPLASMLAWACWHSLRPRSCDVQWIAAAVPLVVGARALGRRAGGRSRSPGAPARRYVTSEDAGLQAVPWTRVASLADLQTHLKAPPGP